MKLERNADEIVKKFNFEIISLQERIKEIEQKIKEKQAFVKAISAKKEVKYSELYEALETNSNKFWRVKEVSMECRKNSFYEIKVYKKYFLTLDQIEIIEKHFMLKYTRTNFDIRITQFY